MKQKKRIRRDLLARTGVLPVDEELGGCDEVVEHVLLLVAYTAFVPAK
jgi:hypothetical protein